jgi:putative thiamine transport system permease protein
LGSGYRIAGAVSALLLACFAGLLIFGLGLLGLRAVPNGDLSAVTSLMREPSAQRAMALTLGTALCSTLLSIGMLALLLAAFPAGRGLAIVERLSRPILSLPHAAFAFGLFLFLTPGGWALRLVHAVTGLFDEPPDIASVNDRFGIMLTIALALKETPFLILVAFPALARLDRTGMLRAGRALGASGGWTFLVALWPRLYREIRLPVMAVLIFGIGVVDMAQILGPTTPPTFAVLVTRELSAGGIDGRAAGEAGAILLILLALAALAIWLAIERLGGMALRLMASSGWRGLTIGRFLQPSAAFLAALMGIAAALAVGTLAVSAFSGAWPYPSPFPTRLTLDGWRDARQLSEVLPDTLLIAGLSSALGFMLVLLVLESRMGGPAPRLSGGSASTILFAPLLVPQVSLAAGLSAAAGWFGLGYGLLATILAHLAYTAPYIWLSLSASHGALDPRFSQIGSALGRAPLAVALTVRLPMLLTSLFVAFGIGLSVSFSLYLPTLIAGGGRIATVTTEAVALASGGERRPIAVYGLAQAALPAIGFLLAALAPRLMRRALGWIGP